MSIDKINHKNNRRAYELFDSYMRGWKCGVSPGPFCTRSEMSGADPKFTNHEDEEISESYYLGWNDGEQTRKDAQKSAARRFDYQPRVIRLMDSKKNSNE